MTAKDWFDAFGATAPAEKPRSTTVTAAETLAEAISKLAEAIESLAEAIELRSP